MVCEDNIRLRISSAVAAHDGHASCSEFALALRPPPAEDGVALRYTVDPPASSWLAPGLVFAIGQSLAIHVAFVKRMPNFIYLAWICEWHSSMM